MSDSSWLCAGCGFLQRMRSIDEFRTVQVKITTAGGAVLVDGRHDLCPNCQNRLIRLANPENWKNTSRPDEG